MKRSLLFLEYADGVNVNGATHRQESRVSAQRAPAILACALLSKLGTRNHRPQGTRHNRRTMEAWGSSSKPQAADGSDEVFAGAGASRATAQQGNSCSAIGGTRLTLDSRSSLFSQPRPHPLTPHHPRTRMHQAAFLRSHLAWPQARVCVLPAWSPSIRLHIFLFFRRSGPPPHASLHRASLLSAASLLRGCVLPAYPSTSLSSTAVFNLL